MSGIRQCLDFYVDGAWVSPLASRTHDLVDPSTEAVVATISLGSASDVDVAVAAARRAFEDFSRTSRRSRAALLDRILEICKRRIPDLAAATSQEMGAPMWLASAAHVPAGLAHLMEARRLLDAYDFERLEGTTLIVREPIGVCALISPWNWPINQIMCKVAPALAAGCTMILKPSEQAPLSALILAEILDEAGVPAGVFNLINGDGPGVGAALAAHPDIDMISFTGSTRAGVMVAQAAAASVKRVTQELGGKSVNILLDDVDISAAISSGVAQMFRNSGQSCNAPSRLLVPRARHDEAVAMAAAAAQDIKVMMPNEATPGSIGPVANAAQFQRVQMMIQQGIDEGAQLVAGGLGRPDGLETGYFVRPTIFADVTNDMAVAREEIFGPVLCIMPYDDEDHAIAIANDSEFGLSGYVQSALLERARAVALRLRTGGILINNPPMDARAPFGGYKRSGNGREWGAFGLEEFLETKAVVGWGDDAPKAEGRA